VPDIVITEFMDNEVAARLGDDFDVVYGPQLVDERERMLLLLADARAVIVRNRTQVDHELLDAAPNLVAVGRLGVGLDNIDMDACASRGVSVFPAAGANAIAVAEYVIGATMVLVRGAYGSSERVAGGDWPRSELMGGEVYGRVLGLVGFGGIAREVASRARGLGMTVIATDPYVAPDDPAWDEVERAETIDDVLDAAEVVSLHVPLTDETRDLIDNVAIDRMQPSAVLVNTSRGGIVDEAAVAGALREGRLGGAALDVFAAEPLGGDAATRWNGVPNVILTPHIAGITEEANVRVSEMTANAVRKALKR
jgi:(S)-sulfolactate dehydrogenase